MLRESLFDPVALIDREQLWTLTEARVFIEDFPARIQYLSTA
jgi:hypothetical protein